jgi:hypothetical protein
LSASRLRIELGGRLSRSLLDEISRRFGTPEVAALDRTTVITTIMDQTGLRALLDLLWDGAAEVHSVTRVSSPDASEAAE